MMFLWLPFLILIPLALVWMAAADNGTTHTTPIQPPTTSVPDPMDIARLRLARGEIASAEFEEIRHVLG